MYKYAYRGGALVQSHPSAAKPTRVCKDSGEETPTFPLLSISGSVVHIVETLKFLDATISRNLKWGDAFPLTTTVMPHALIIQFSFFSFCFFISLSFNCS